MATIKYINDDIDSDILNLKLAENYLSYLDSRTFDKNKWAEAYKNVMNAGITGISVDGGRYSLQHNGPAFDDPDGYYGDVADYIINIAQGINEANKAKIKEEEEKKKNLIPYRLDGSPEGFTNYLLNNLYGGNKKIFEERWNGLDEADLYGLKGTTKRRAELANQLRLYRDQLDGSKYSFEGTPFKDINDLKNRINEAITELENPNDNDYSALRALGINDSLWLDTNKENADKARAQALEQLKAKQAELLLKLQAQKANQFKYAKFIDARAYNGTPPSGTDALKRLNEYYNLPDLSKQQRSELVGIFKYAQKHNMLEDLSPEELNKFKGLPTLINTPRRLKKIRGLNGFYYDTEQGRIVQPFMSIKDAPLKTILDVINENSPEALKKQQNKQAAINMNTPVGDFDLTNFKNFSPEMQKEIEALAWEAGSILDPEAFSGSVMALYASHLRDEANPNRGTLEKWFDRGTAALGGIQGVGDLLLTGKLGYRLYQLGKSIGSVTKFAGMLGAGFGAVGAYEAKDSIAKLANPGSLTPQDLENIAYGLMGLVGLKSFNKARNKQTIGKQANPTVTEHSITVKDKDSKETHTIKIDESTAKEILQIRTLGKKKETVDSEILNMPKVKESIKKYKEANSDKKLEIEGASIVNNSKSAFGISGRNKVVKSKQVKNPNAPEYAPVGTKWYNPFGYMAKGNNKWSYYLAGGWQRKAWENTVPELSSKGLRQRIKEFWSPEPRPILNKTQEVDESKLISIDSNKGESPYARKPLELKKVEVKESDLGLSPKPINYNRETMLRYNDAINKKFGNAELSSGNVKIGDNNFLVVKLADGTYSIFYKGENIGNERNQIEILKIASNFVKNLNKKDSPFGKVSAEEMGKLLREFKAKGWLKHGGRLDKLKIQIYKKFYK